MMEIGSAGSFGGIIAICLEDVLISVDGTSLMVCLRSGSYVKVFYLYKASQRCLLTILLVVNFQTTNSYMWDFINNQGHLTVSQKYIQAPIDPG